MDKYGMDDPHILAMTVVITYDRARYPDLKELEAKLQSHPRKCLDVWDNIIVEDDGVSFSEGRIEWNNKEDEEEWKREHSILKEE